MSGKAKPRWRRHVSAWPWLLVGGVALALAIAGLNAGDSGPYRLASHGDPAVSRRVQGFPAEGSGHVPQGTPIGYKTTPPTSGSHYDQPTAAGFYDRPQPAGNLVHSLEHGDVVVYYRSGALAPADAAALRGWVSHHRDPFAGFVVVPNPYANPPYLALTAWTHLLTLDRYDGSAVRAFASEYLGRGPEHPVR